MPSEREMNDGPTQSDLRALWRSMRGPSGKGWHPVSVPLFVAFFMIIMGGLFTILQLFRWNAFDHSIATMEEILIVRLGSMLAILALSFFIGTRMAWHWPGTNFVKYWNAFALAGLGLLAGLFVYAMVRVGPGGLLVGVASEWFEGSMVMTSAPFMLFMLIGWLIQSKRVGTDRFCTVCNYTLDDHMNRCPECGHTLDGPWRVLLGVRQKRTMAVFIYLACFLVFMFGAILTPQGSHAMRRALIIIPDDRLLGAAAETRSWSEGLEYQMWSRAWNKPGDRRKLVDAMLGVPEDSFSHDHTDILLAVLMDERTPKDLRRDLLDEMELAIGLTKYRDGPLFAFVAGSPLYPRSPVTPKSRVPLPPGIAFRVEPVQGIRSDFNATSVQSMVLPPPPPVPLGWQDGAFLVRTQSSTRAHLPIELLNDAPDTFWFTVVLMLDVPYRFGSPAFTGRFAPYPSRRFTGIMAVPATPEGLPEFAAPEPKMMKFSVPVTADRIRLPHPDTTPVRIHIEHAR